MTDIKYEFLCKLCCKAFSHASGIQDHLMDNHSLRLEQTYSTQYVRAIKLPDKIGGT